MRYICTSIVATLVFVGTTVAATINVPGDYPTIQAAVNAAGTGDLIAVGPGTYTSTSFQVVDMLGKAITLRSTVGAVHTIIDAEGQRRGLVCDSGEGRDTIINGFTITGGSANATSELAGGNIFCDSASPTIRNCLLTSGEAFQGGGLYCRAGGPAIENCQIMNNSSGYSGGGGSFFECNLPIEITECTFTHNNCGVQPNGGGGGGLHIWNCTNAVISSCSFQNNASGNASAEGGGLYLYLSSSFPNANLRVTNSTFTGNSGGRGGGIYILTWDEPGSAILVDGCTFSGNMATSKDGVVNGAGGGGLANSLSTTTTQSHVSFVDCDFESNAAELYGGGLYVRGPIVIDGCEIHGNEVPLDGGLGGGLYSHVYNVDDEPPIVSDTFICGNTPDQVSGPFVDVTGNFISQDCPTGACCDDNLCEQLSESDCYDAYPGGTWLGWLTSCDDCLDTDQGACCLADELRGIGCVITDPSNCFQLGGEWMGSGSDCSVCIPPAQPGGCCTPSGCTMLWQDECLSIGGQWLGDGVDCGQCPETGACCLCDGCLVTWEQDCLAAGGEWLANSGCDECPPTAEVGPCCLASGCIMNATEADCSDNLGEWLGPNGYCADCPQPCPGDLNGDWVVNIDDLLILLGHYGSCP